MGYPPSANLTDIMMALNEHNIRGVQVNSSDREIVYPVDIREQIDALLASVKEKNQVQ